MDKSIYQFAHSNEVFTPALLYYKDIILQNIEKAIRIAGNADRLWPHVKTHKTRELTKLLIEHGITRFKCATIAEAEVVASCCPTDVVVAYPLVGPNIQRFLNLQTAYPSVHFWAVGDDMEQVRLLSDAAKARNAIVRFMVDVNVGQCRTGVPVEKVLAFYRFASALAGIEADGLHCYDGHIHDSDYVKREKMVDEIIKTIFPIRDSLQNEGYSCSHLVMGGTPTFPCYAKYPDVYMSPGTIFLSDYNYSRWYPEMDFVPAGIIITRVVSHPTPNTFTLDLGYKAIASDATDIRGVIVGMENITVPVAQSEEHWVFAVIEGHESEIPNIGDEVFVMPAHICPSSALYPAVPVISHGEIVEYWEIAARNRKLCY